MTIFTIGYEGIDVDDFLSLLRKNNIETIVDIRELPLSRKPGFSKNVLNNILNMGGYEYIHLSELGCPKSIRNQYRSDGNWELYKQEFIKYLDTKNEVLSALATMAASSNCALLCFEADYKLCHRSIVANAINETHGISVSHVQIKKSKTKQSADLQTASA